MKRPLLSSATAIAVALSALPAVAQTTDSDKVESGLEEIVVTAQRRAENLQDVPVAVTALTAESLGAKGIDTTTDLTLVIPGLTYTTVVGSALPRIRGVGAAISLGGNENPVATYVDGVYIASATASVLAFNNIEQIAVLKGPQGTLFGRNATGGLIQVTTRDPSSELGGEASLSYGNLDTVGANLYMTGGLTENLAADLAMYYNDQQEGYGRNLVTGAEVGKSRDFAARSKWKLDIGSATTVRLAFDYSKTRAAAPGFRAVYGTVPVTGVPFTGGKFDIASDVDPRLEVEQSGGSLTVSHDFGEVSLLSITAYRESDFHAIFDIDKTAAAIAKSDLSQPDRQFSQEFQLLSSDNAPLRWVLGAYYFNSHGAYDPLRITSVANDQFISSTQKTESSAAFGQASYNFTDRTALTLGLRYTAETKDYRASARIVLPSGVTTDRPAVTDSLDESRLTWRVALDHHFSDDLLGYVSYNRGFKSGGFNPQRFTQPLLPFEPEILDSFEAGVKADLLDRRLRINVAGFYYDYENIQINAFQGGISTIYNAASAKIHGVDLDVTIAPVSDLTLTGGLSWIHARFGDFPGAVISTPQVPNGTTILGGNAVGTGDAEGNRLPLTPDWTVNLGADYSVLLPRGRVALSANYFHSDGWRAEPDNRIGQDPYDLVNASATWFIDDDDENYSLKLWGKNLSNEAYAVQMNAQPQSDGVAVGPGRSYGVTLGVKF